MMTTNQVVGRVSLDRPAAFRRAASRQCAPSLAYGAPRRQQALQVVSDAFWQTGSASVPRGESNKLRRPDNSIPHSSARPSVVSAAAAFDGGSGGGAGDSGGGSGGGGGGGDDSNKEDLNTALATAGRRLESFPADFSTALTTGTVGVSALATWLNLEKNGLFKFLLYSGGQGFRERLLGDPLFMAKLGIELGVGVCTKLTAEKTKRGKDFVKELDFVLANVLMAILADFALTWLPAPTLPLSPRLAASASGVQRFLQSCPANAFQMATATRRFTVLQRFMAIIRNGAKLFVVGTGASFIGTGTTNAIIAIRSKLEPSTEKQTEDMNVVTQSLAYGLYMSVSSNLRYQILAGIIEERGIERVLGHKYPLASSIASFAVRTGNTFVGSLLWVDFVRILGLQKQVVAPPPPPPPPPPPTKGGKKGKAEPKAAAKK